MGTILPGRFEPIRLLRKDRASSTFVATDRGLGRNEVVVRIVGRGNFSDTASLVATFSWYRGLRHEFLSEVLDAGLTSNRDLFCVREYHAPSEFFTSANIVSVKALISAVDFLYSMGRVHGSIKPSNVFAAGDTFRIADPWIGQKRELAEEDIRFSAPEVLSGGSPAIDSDLYSLGALLYRFYSGRDPFEGSDLESLKARYIWASPRSLISVSHVSRQVGEIVTNLLNKDPGQRKAAFDSLKDELGVSTVSATRAPAVGLSGLVDDVLQKAQAKQRLTMVLVEGPAGTGKSRFIEELQNRASLGGQAFVTSETGTHPYGSLIRRVLAVIDERRLGAGAACLSRLRSFSATEQEPSSKSEQEEVARDLISLLASVARQTRLLLLIEDVDRAGRKLLPLIGALVQQLSDLELSIVVTARPDAGFTNELGNIEDFLRGDFRTARLSLLNSAESRLLSSYFSTDYARLKSAETQACGNPSFIDQYCSSHRKTGIPKQVSEALSSMVLCLSRDAKRVAETLSLFEEPVDWSVLSAVSGASETSIRYSLSELERLGLVEASGLSIRYPAVRRLLHARIPAGRRIKLHAKCFQYLETKDCSDTVLASHALQGELYEVAARLYRRLGANRFAAKDYGPAVHYYNVVSECSRRDAAAQPLSPMDNVNLARCLAVLGDKRSARQILERLLTSNIVSENAEFLSAVYAAFAAPVMENSVEERIRLLRLAIGCLREDSPQLPYRYRGLAIALLSAGDSAEATEVKKKAESHRDFREEDFHLDDVQASMLMNEGNFKEARRFLSRMPSQQSTPGVVANNLAVCVEQLGDIRRALEIQRSALQTGEASGTLWVQVMSLGNLGSMETKLGNFSVAEKFFDSAIRTIGNLERLEEKAALVQFGITFADAAGHCIQRGQYRKALEYLSRIKEEFGGPLPIERFLIAFTRCELHIALGQPKKLLSVLEDTKRMTLKSDYCEVERLLIEARLRDVSTHLRVQLEEAISVCVRLGTLYQECRVRLALARTLHLLGEKKQSRLMAKTAARTSRRNGYRVLSARALFLVGLTAEDDAEKEFALRKSLDEAAEMGLTPLMAECTYAIGSWRFAQRAYAEARDFLSKSVSISTRLAEDLSDGDRRSYISQTEIKAAKMLLEEASMQASSLPSRRNFEILDKETGFFVQLYRLTAAMTAAADFPSALAELLEALKQALDHPVVVVLGAASQMTLHPAGRTVSSEELRKRVSGIVASAGDKAYITGIGTSRRRDTAVWMPISSLAHPGGIYVECVVGRSTLDEREIEFLTIAAGIAAAAFDRVYSKVGPVEAAASAEFYGIVGNSKEIRGIRQAIEMAATNSATVLIEGESGTGKELVARAIHQRSSRSHGSFVAVDCGALPEGLIEAELFGARKGAYTGAIADRPGLFEAAHNGTIFLDEISNLGLAAQAKLLRVLQEREIRRIGSMMGRSVDVRLIAATNSNLERLVREGKFREDLLYRLRVLHVLVPPLRERREDIPVLATRFLERLNLLNQTKRYFGLRVMEKFLGYGYPGNVRELQNAVERAFYSTNSAAITQVDFFRDSGSIDSPKENETERWFKDLSEGRENFWLAVKDRYKRRDISRERVVALVDFGLRTTRGNYKTMASMFQIPKEEYHRFMDFLRRSRCLLDFRPYRRID